MQHILTAWRQGDTNNRSYSISHTPGYGPQDVSTFQLVLNDSHDADPEHTLTRFLHGDAQVVSETGIYEFCVRTVKEWSQGVRDKSEQLSNVVRFSS